MGISGYIDACVDFMLFLHLERCQMDWQSRLLYRTVPVFLADHFVDSWNHSAWCY